MKKILLLSVCVALLSSCGNMGKNDAMKSQNDSLSQVLAQRDAELNGIMEAFNEIQDGFRMINEAESRVDLETGAVEGRSNVQKIKDDIVFIMEKLDANRKRIAELEEQLKNSRYASSQLKTTIANLNKELLAKTQQIETLQAELASKNIRIAELDDAIVGLTQHMNDLVAENKAKSATVATQDKALNAAWFVFGTSSELKEQKIVSKKFLQKKKVLESDDFNKEYFTQIDIRTDKQIMLYSPEAELLTSHPVGSYEFQKNEKGQLALLITNPNKFWSVSRYLVIEVK
jgi:chromosome segregation ATPase